MFSVSSANPFAYIALVMFIPFGLIVFRFMRPTRAALLIVLAGAMFLPELVYVDLPGLPRMGKSHITFTTLTLCMLFYQWPMLARSRPGRGIESAAVVMVVGGWLTTLTNGDNLFYGPRMIGGMPPYEMITASMIELLRYGLPFYFGRVLFRSERDLRDLISAMVIAGLVYSLFQVVELRLSPQMHRWTYGFHQNDFGTVNRWGGYRPMVYMESGIALGIFMVNTVIAAASATRARLAILGRIPAAWATAALFAMLMLGKSLAAMVYGAVLAPLILMLSPRLLARVAMLLCVLVFFYPSIRIAEIFPWKSIVAAAETIDPARARSLNYRFENEERMLGKARERFAFGWGGYTRNWVYDEETGIPPSVPDGYWIIRLGSAGLVGFYSTFALYVLPVVFAWRRLGRIPGRGNQYLMAGLMLIVIIRAVDQLPNGLYSSYPIFMAGALTNLSRSLPRRHARRVRGRRAAREAEESVAEEAEPAPEVRGTASSAFLGPSGPRRDG